MSLTDIRIPFILLLHRNDDDYKYLGYINRYRKPTDRIFSLKEDVVQHLVEEHKIDRKDVRNLTYYQLYEEASCHWGELGSRFKEIDYLSITGRMGATDCSVFDTFKNLGFKNSRDGPKKVYRLIIVARVYPLSKRVLPVIEEAGDGLEGREAAVQKARTRPCPSTGATHSHLRYHQISGQPDVSYNSMPLSLEPSPISIYTSIFGELKEFVNEPIGSFEPTFEEIDKARELIIAASQFYPNESDRQAAFNDIKFLGKDDFWVCVTMRVFQKIFRPDGCCLITKHPWFCYDITSFFGEIKRWFGEGGCHPVDQAAEDWKKLVSSREYEDMVRASSCPAILIGVMGNQIDIWGAAYSERFFFEHISQVRLGRKQNGVSRISGLAEAILEVAKLLRLLQIADAGLQEYYKSRSMPQPREFTGVIRTGAEGKGSASTGVDAKLASTGSHGGQASTGDRGSQARTDETLDADAPLNTDRDIGEFPCWQSFSVLPTSDVKITYKIQYERRLTPGYFNKPVYLATLSAAGIKSRKVVVKFAYDYCIDAHKLLASRGWAPELIFAEVVSPKDGGPGMFAVVMEYIDGPEVDLRSGNATHKAILKDAMDLLHDKGYVFGDLREPNLLLRENKLYLIDFDWCGKAGEVRYPLDICLDNVMGWHKGVGAYRFMEKVHDTFRMRLLMDMMDGGL